MKHSLSLSTLILGLALVATDAQAQWTYSSGTSTGTCSSIPANMSTGFTLTPVLSRTLYPTNGSTNIQRPIKMDFDLLPDGKVDIYWIQKNGQIRRLNATSNALELLGTVPNVLTSFSEDGLVGFALDPDFKNNNALYVLYSRGSSGNQAGSASNGWRLSRFTVDATTKALNTGSETTIIHIPAGTGNRWHTGGGMQFDTYGNLYVALGENEALFQGAGNTADMRGGIIRIRPKAEGGYTVPAGNFGEYWAGRFTTQGRTALAAQYLDTNKVHPAVYIKGSRNPYAFGVDRYKLGRVAWSECGPDVSNSGTEEHNASDFPAYGGWPFWAGNGYRLTSKASSYDEPNEPSAAQWSTYSPSGMPTSAPLNTWAGKAGVDTLPPMLTPIYNYNRSCSMGGPIYRYDGSNTSTVKLPPHFDNVMFMSDFSNNNVWAVKLNDSAKAVGSVTQVLLSGTYARSSTNPSIVNIVDFRQGPDGALYFLNFGAGCCEGNANTGVTTGISRLTYTGDCQDPALVPVTTSITPRTMISGNVSWLRVGTSQITLNDDGSGRIASGTHTIRILDVNGRVVHTFKGQGTRTYDMPALEHGKIFVLRAETPIGTAVRTFSRI